MKLKRVNLYWLYTASSIKISDYRCYDKIVSNRDKTTSVGEREKGSLYYLVDYLLEHNCSVDLLDNFYYSYTIPHIGKEFDLLKISNDYVLNIELKSENVGFDRIKTQLLCNYKYLKYLSKPMYCFTFVSDEKVFYKLTSEFELVKSNVNEVLEALSLFKFNEYVDIDSLFRASDYLVSPISNPNKFINDQYFLTTQQEFIKNKIISDLDKETYFKISGDAGTGKTLLLFDIAKELSKNEEVLIIVCNRLSISHLILDEHYKNIKIVDDLSFFKLDSKYILIDEAQRMDKVLWDEIDRSFDVNRQKIIFTLDSKQVLTKEEIKMNNNLIIDKLNPSKHKLSNRIRLNESISSFTYRLFDLSLTKYFLDFSNINIHYASNKTELNAYFKMYEKYTFIGFDEKYNWKNKVEILDVLGNDYENVLMVLDNNFMYSNNKLSVHNASSNAYLYLKLLYQGLSRTREKLTLIIYKNKSLFTKIVKEGANDEKRKKDTKK